jgi:uncharacterized protein YecT (DUF1311 family)
MKQQSGCHFRAAAILAALVAMPIGASASGAAPASATAPARPCASATTQGAMSSCWAQQANASAQRVTAAYQTLLAATSGARRALVISAQNAWVTYRETECKATAAAVAGGSAQPMVFSICRNQHNNARVSELNMDLHPMGG